MKSMSMVAVKKIEEFSFKVWLPGQEKEAPESTLTITRSAGFSLKKPDGVRVLSSFIFSPVRFPVELFALFGELLLVDRLGPSPEPVQAIQD